MEYGEFKAGKPYGKVTVYAQDGTVFNVLIEDPDESWLDQPKYPIPVSKDNPAFYRRDHIALRPLTDYGGLVERKDYRKEIEEGLSGVKEGLFATKEGQLETKDFMKRFFQNRKDS